jgi:hypothetical protein
VNVKRLEGTLLNFWVAKSRGLIRLPEPPLPGAQHDPDSGSWHPATYRPSSNWSHAGPIVSDEWFAIEDILIEWFGPDWTSVNTVVHTPTVWFMRAYVASQFGDEVEDLVDGQQSHQDQPASLRNAALCILPAGVSGNSSRSTI